MRPLPTPASMLHLTMIPAEVAQSYDAIASQWTGEDFNRANGVEAHHKALQFLDRTGRALDVGCGSSGRFIELLLERGFVVEGLDISAEMIRLARERQPQVMFHHADVCEWQPQGEYDFISAWDSVWHVPLASQESVWAKLLHALAPGGVLILSTGGLDAPGEVQNAHMGVLMYHATPGMPALCHLIAETNCVIRHLEYDQWPEKHLVVVVQRM
jgi:2-polyprenyl-3-methyl-5-hydroxy-6-metoxy-1,4-benzoquinol methylase